MGFLYLGWYNYIYIHVYICIYTYIYVYSFPFYNNFFFFKMVLIIFTALSTRIWPPISAYIQTLAMWNLKHTRLYGFTKVLWNIRSYSEPGGLGFFLHLASGLWRRLSLSEVLTYWGIFTSTVDIGPSIILLVARMGIRTKSPSY